MVKKLFYYFIQINIRLTGKWRGSGRTTVTKIVMGLCLRKNKISSQTFAKMKPGVMGIKLMLF
jgi:hypothetical protein